MTPPRPMTRPTSMAPIVASSIAPAARGADKDPAMSSYLVPIVIEKSTRGERKRFTLPTARNRRHQPLLGGVMAGQASDIEIEAREMLRIRERLYQIYAEATGQPFDRIAKDCDRNKWLDEKEMLEYGLV